MSSIAATLATADQLNAFAGRDKVAEEFLPRIIRRLVIASLTSAKEIDFPSGKSLNAGGWDGHVVSSGADPFVPEGVSGWELSVREDKKHKADEDYVSRTEGVPVGERAETSLVLWTMRKWNTRKKWVEGQRTKEEPKKWKDGWKDVRSYDAHDLETWLQHHPALHLWVSKVIGVCPQAGAVDILSHWTDWSETPDLPLPSAVLTRGYEQQRDSLFKALVESRSVITIQWERADLAAAFVAACLAGASDPAVEKLATRCIYVKTEDAFEELAREHQGLILVLGFTPAAIGLARKNGHTVLLTVGRDFDGTANVVLAGRKPSDLDEALKEWEPEEERRRNLAEKATRKFTSFYRSLSPPGLYSAPSWSSPENVPLAMLGQWDTAYEGDREVLAEMAGVAFREENERAIALSKSQDALLHQAGTLIALVDVEDAWYFLGRHVTDHHLDVLSKVVTTVFGEDDPRYLEENIDDENQLAMFPDRHGRLRHSLTLRKGLAGTLCFLGSNGEAINSTGKHTGEDIARLAVRNLFEKGSDWRHLCSIAPWFREFAEAGPDEFLSALERDLKGNPEKIRQLFRDDQTSFFGSSSPHTYVLWALELLAWSPEYLVRAALALARLTTLDPGGRTSNRPLESLREIFLAWHPGTMASLDDRMEALGVVVASEPETGWKLVRSLLPQDHDSAMPTANAKYRPWGPLWQLPLTNGEIWSALDTVTELALNLAAGNTERLAALISEAENFRPRGFELLLKGLDQIDLSQFQPQQRKQLRDSLREKLARHRSHPDAQWALPAERLSALDAVLSKWPSDKPSEEWEWVFSDHAIFELGPGDDFGAKQEELNALQARAAKAILEIEGLQGLLHLAEKSDSPWLFGIALQRSGVDLDLQELAPKVFPQSRQGELFFMGLLEGAVRAGRLKETRGLASSDWARSLIPEQQAKLLRCLPFDSQIFQDLRNRSSDVQRAYWSSFGRVDAIRADEKLVVPALNQLIELGLFRQALDALVFLVHEPTKAPSSDLILTIIEGAISGQVDAQTWGGLGYEVGKLLDFLDAAQDSDPVRVGRLELVFSQLLSLRRKPKRLNRLIAEDPELYIVLLKAVYRPRNGSDKEEKESANLPPASAAFHVLRGLSTLPGQDSDGNIDAQTLLNWVSAGRELARNVNRLEVFDETLGEWFSNAPVGADGIPPHQAVREVFQMLESDEFERGYAVGIYNLRGVVTKTLDEGGEQERELAATFAGYADKLKTKWHRVARAMRSISDSYYQEAKREDEDR